MKKFVGLLVIGLFLAIPPDANASKLGWGELDVFWSGPNAGGYYGDYDGTVVWSDFGYTTVPRVEIFCVSEDHANSTEVVDFYTITSDLDDDFGFGFFADLSQAAWIADNWTTYGVITDFNKVEAQKAIWEIMGVVTGILGSDGLDKTLYDLAIGQTGYLTSNWYYAHSPGNNTSADHQDYLTPVSSVPEPATMMLFGSGLLGFAFIGRKRLFKRG